MAKGICRVGDIVTGICRAHKHPRQFTGTWTTGSATVGANNKGVVRVGDTGTTDCGHNIQAIVGSSTVSSNGIGVVRVGDPVIVIQGGNGIAITGSNDVISG